MLAIVITYGVSSTDGVPGDWESWLYDDSCGVTNRNRTRPCEENPDSNNGENCTVTCGEDVQLFQDEEDVDNGCCTGIESQSLIQSIFCRHVVFYVQI